jgi:hypothetical protein
MFLTYEDFLNEKINFDVNVTKPLYFEFGEGSALLKRGEVSHIRQRFERTINDIGFRDGNKIKNPDGVNNKFEIKPEHVVDDVLFALPKIIDMLFRGRLELIKGWGVFVSKEICIDIDPKYKPKENSIVIQIKNIATGLNTIIAFDYFKSRGGDYDTVGLTGITVIWKWDFKSPCLRKDNIIEIDNNNIFKYYKNYPLENSLDSYMGKKSNKNKKK